MKRELLNASISYGSLTDRIEKLQQQIVELSMKRAAIVASLSDSGLAPKEIGHLLDIPLIKVAVLADMGHARVGRSDPGARA